MTVTIESEPTKNQAVAVAARNGAAAVSAPDPFTTRRS